MSTISIALIGSGGVGKTCLCRRLVQNEFDEAYNPSGIEKWEKDLSVNNMNYHLNLIDTAGQDEMVAIVDMACQDADAFVIVFSVAAKLTFEDVDKLIGRANDIKPGAPCILVGNKCDLPERDVTEADGQAKAQQYHAVYIEASAKSGQNVTQVFEKTVQAYINANTSKKSKKEGGGGCCEVA